MTLHCHARTLDANSDSRLQQTLRSLSADVRQLPGFAGSGEQGGALTVRDLLYPDSYSDAYQLGVDPSQGPALNAAYLSVSANIGSISGCFCSDCNSQIMCCSAGTIVLSNVCQRTACGTGFLEVCGVQKGTRT